ncbi:Glycosyltransferase involved in cell wall bisynthesis [Paenibacillus sp. UNCCL117]|uniref:glycosyltransferase family 4 protein n=1 Tax=unclassified Paenibacillus TaxID=185978 RepID=UPI00088D0309|nr:MULTISPECIES: glycosyltransferase family 4 protein [unclassified Paenibacillus]SDC02907.1 Glycosyltransferase involved in cell wall bisynthesis [Paenibacillus sp. cl123]SFW36954.1 Glycosyltransferase involved in cell wall bisynthesis [Paenibacillus sp. UNCCL117]
MKKVLVLTKYYHPIRNGLSDHTVYMANLLREGSYTVSVICEEADSRRQPEQAAEADRVSVHPYRGYRELFRVFSRVCRTERPDVVLFQYVPHMWGQGGVAPIASLLPLWIGLRFRVPVIAYLHELFMDWSAKPKGFLLALCHRLQLAMIGLSSRSLIITNNKRERLLKRGPWSRKVHRIPGGNVSGRKEDHLRKPYYSYPYLTWFGTISALQRLDQLAHAFAGLAAQRPDVRLVLIGGFDPSSPRMVALRKLAADHGVEDRLVIRGFVEDDELSDTLYGSLANVYVEASGPSGRRGVIAAYLRSGRPIIAIDGSETDADFRHGDNVYLVNDGDAAALSEAMLRVCTDDGLRRQLERGARKLYKETYSDGAILHKLKQVLESV